MGVHLDSQDEYDLTVKELVAEMRTSVGTYEFTLDNVCTKYKHLPKTKIIALLKEAIEKRLLLQNQGWYRVAEQQKIKVRKENR
jgi:predicted amidophosphoribosyltransferase